MFRADDSVLISLDEPTHPLPNLIHHHTTSLLSTANTLTEKHTTQIELLRRRLSHSPAPTPSTRRITFLQAIAKAADKPENTTAGRAGNSGSAGAVAVPGGWDTDVVEDMWRAVLGYIVEMGGLIGDLVGLKDVVDRIADKASVPAPRPSSLLRSLV